MSKASEWAAHVANVKRPTFSSSRIEAECDDYGNLTRVEISTIAIPAEEAIRFARWILDTFGEEKT